MTEFVLLATFTGDDQPLPDVVDAVFESKRANLVRRGKSILAAGEIEGRVRQKPGAPEPQWLYYQRLEVEP